MLDKLPLPAQQWAEKLHWQERRYLLSLCHLLCAAPEEHQAEFLDQYTAEGLIAKIAQDYDTQDKVQRHLDEYLIDTQINPTTLRRYIRQFYIHSAQDARREHDKLLEAALRLVMNPDEKSYALNYILGFELLKKIFQMSWLQQERFYSLQYNQEEFFLTYIKPIQCAHQLNGIVHPRDKNLFFAQRNYFVRVPQISDKKVQELVMVTFTTEVVSNLGFSIVRNIRPVPFDYSYIYQSETSQIFS